jgi:hypothetical protein
LVSSLKEAVIIPDSPDQEVNLIVKQMMWYYDFNYLYGIVTLAMISQACEVPFIIKFNKKALDKSLKEY